MVVKVARPASPRLHRTQDAPIGHPGTRADTRWTRSGKTRQKDAAGGSLGEGEGKQGGAVEKSTGVKSNVVLRLGGSNVVVHEGPLYVENVMRLFPDHHVVPASAASALPLLRLAPLFSICSSTRSPSSAFRSGSPSAAVVRAKGLGLPPGHILMPGRSYDLIPMGSAAATPNTGSNSSSSAAATSSGGLARAVTINVEEETGEEQEEGEEEEEVEKEVEGKARGGDSRAESCLELPVEDATLAVPLKAHQAHQVRPSLMRRRSPSHSVLPGCMPPSPTLTRNSSEHRATAPLSRPPQNAIFPGTPSALRSCSAFAHPPTSPPAPCAPPSPAAAVAAMAHKLGLAAAGPHASQREQALLSTEFQRDDSPVQPGPTCVPAFGKSRPVRAAAAACQREMEVDEVLQGQSSSSSSRSACRRGQIRNQSKSEPLAGRGRAAGGVPAWQRELEEVEGMFHSGPLPASSSAPASAPLSASSSASSGEEARRTQRQSKSGPLFGRKRWARGVLVANGQMERLKEAQAVKGAKEENVEAMPAKMEAEGGLQHESGEESPSLVTDALRFELDDVERVHADGARKSHSAAECLRARSVKDKEPPGPVPVFGRSMSMRATPAGERMAKQQGGSVFEAPQKQTPGGEGMPKQQGESGRNGHEMGTVVVSSRRAGEAVHGTLTSLHLVEPQLGTSRHFLASGVGWAAPEVKDALQPGQQPSPKQQQQQQQRKYMVPNFSRSSSLRAAPAWETELAQEEALHAADTAGKGYKDEGHSAAVLRGAVWDGGASGREAAPKKVMSAGGCSGVPAVNQEAFPAVGRSAARPAAVFGRSASMRVSARRALDSIPDDCPVMGSAAPGQWVRFKQQKSSGSDAAGALQGDRAERGTWLAAVCEGAEKGRREESGALVVRSSTPPRPPSGLGEWVSADSLESVASSASNPSPSAQPKSPGSTPSPVSLYCPLKGAAVGPTHRPPPTNQQSQHSAGPGRSDATGPTASLDSKPASPPSSAQLVTVDRSPEVGAAVAAVMAAVRERSPGVPRVHPRNRSPSMGSLPPSLSAGLQHSAPQKFQARPASPPPPGVPPVSSFTASATAAMLRSRSCNSSRPLRFLSSSPVHPSPGLKEDSMVGVPGAYPCSTRGSPEEEELADGCGPTFSVWRAPELHRNAATAAAARAAVAAASRARNTAARHAAAAQLGLMSRHNSSSPASSSPLRSSSPSPYRPSSPSLVPPSLSSPLRPSSPSSATPLITSFLLSTPSPASAPSPTGSSSPDSSPSPPCCPSSSSPSSTGHQASESCEAQARQSHGRAVQALEAQGVPSVHQGIAALTEQGDALPVLRGSRTTTEGVAEKEGAGWEATMPAAPSNAELEGALRVFRQRMRVQSDEGGGAEWASGRSLRKQRKDNIMWNPGLEDVAEDRSLVLEQAPAPCPGNRRSRFFRFRLY